MEMTSLSAKFASQEDAESAVRKLAALRGDRFRLERVSPSAIPVDVEGFQTSAAVQAAVDFADDALGEPPPDSPQQAQRDNVEEKMQSYFALSMNIPSAALIQARTVIQLGGGQVVR